MAAIDSYAHELLGFIECPSSFDFVYNNNTRNIAIYKLLEDVGNEETQFEGKRGDILVGGGRGEAPAFRISIPETILFFTDEEFVDFDTIACLFKAFWSPTEAFKLCDGFLKCGWNPERPIEFWLAENTCRVIAANLEGLDVEFNRLKDLKADLVFLKHHG
jgi:hypothetical protein